MPEIVYCYSVVMCVTWPSVPYACRLEEEVRSGTLRSESGVCSLRNRIPWKLAERAALASVNADCPEEGCQGRVLAGIRVNELYCPRAGKYCTSIA